MTSETTLKDKPRAALTRVANGQRIELCRDATVGRLAECDITLDQGHSSRTHARITFVQGAMWIEDLGSANGTFINGVRIEKLTQVKSGDKLRFDIEDFVVVLPDVAVAPPDESAPKKRPGSWADTAALREGGQRTKYIPPGQINLMLGREPAPVMAAPPDLEGPYLQIIAGSGAGRGGASSVALPASTAASPGPCEWAIGSQVDGDVVFPDDGVSALHAKIINDGKRWKVVDQISANGTFVNGKRCNVSYLSAGDRLRFGPVGCVFRLPKPNGGQLRSKGGPETDRRGARSLLLPIAVLAALGVLAMAYVSLR